MAQSAFWKNPTKMTCSENARRAQTTLDLECAKSTARMKWNIRLKQQLPNTFMSESESLTSNTTSNQVKSFEETHEPLLFDIKYWREYGQLFTQWAPLLVDAFGLKSFALGKYPSVYHSATVTSGYPAKVLFGFVFMAHTLQKYEPAPAGINALRGRRAWMTIP